MPIKQNPEINQNTNINLAYDKGYIIQIIQGKEIIKSGTISGCLDRNKAGFLLNTVSEFTVGKETPLDTSSRKGFHTENQVLKNLGKSRKGRNWGSPCFFKPRPYHHL